MVNASFTMMDENENIVQDHEKNPQYPRDSSRNNSLESTVTLVPFDLASTCSGSSFGGSDLEDEGERDEEEAANGGEESDVSTTIIDGKRAISLSNFGKYAAQQQRRQGRGSIGGGPLDQAVPQGAIFGYPIASAGFRNASRPTPLGQSSMHSSRIQSAKL